MNFPGHAIETVCVRLVRQCWESEGLAQTDERSVWLARFIACRSTADSGGRRQTFSFSGSTLSASSNDPGMGGVAVRQG